MDMKLIISGNEYEIGSDTVSVIAAQIPDHALYTELYADLAKMENSDIREIIAYKENIDDSTIEALLGDSQLLVLKQILENERGRMLVSEDRLLELADINDSELLCLIADNVDSFRQCDALKLGSKLISSSDVKVKQSLASGWETPEEILYTLAEDTDVDVSLVAREALARK